MRLNDYEERNDIFFDWVIESVPANCSVLDVGANDGTFCPQIGRIAKLAGRFAGVDPDREKLERNQFVTERYFSVLEDAAIAPESFDIVYSVFVLEHVLDEERFIAAASRVLKPGGSFFFITPNGAHYFAILASFFEKLGLQRQALGLVRSARHIESYHYPAVYRLNRPKKIECVGKRYGFDRFEYRYCENFYELSTYFPGPTKVFPFLWEKAVAASGQEHLLVNLLGRMVKASKSERSEFV